MTIYWFLGVDGAWSRAKLAGYTVPRRKLYNLLPQLVTCQSSFKLQFTPSHSISSVTRIRRQFDTSHVLDQTLYNVNEVSMKMKERRGMRG